jgi:hypothetical protein
MSTNVVISYIAAKADVTKRFGRYSWTKYRQYPAFAQSELRKIWKENQTARIPHAFELQFSRVECDVSMTLAIPGFGTLWSLQIDREFAETMTLALAKLFAEIGEDCRDTETRLRQAYVLMRAVDRADLAKELGEGDARVND